MRTHLMLLLVGMSSALLADSPITIGTLPAGEYADTEVTTNCPFTFENPKASQLLVNLELLATLSNNVELAFGKDDDQDGILALDEIAMSLGWDSGSWFVREGLASGSSVPAYWTAMPVSGAGFKKFNFTMVMRGDSPKRIVVAEGGSYLSLALPSPLPAFLFDRSWNMMRLAVRGVDAPQESVWVKAKVNGTLIIAR